MAVLSTVEAQAWQLSWDRQQEGYLPDREQRLAAMIDLVEACGPDQPAVLDLAGGTGSISLRALRRLPQATTTLVDIDPVLLAIARSSVDQRTTVVSANLRWPDWRTALPRQRYDAILTATALHWLPGERLAELYGELRDLLEPGGVFVNADHMPDDGLPTVTKRLDEYDGRRRDAGHATGAAVSWEQWWTLVRDTSHLAHLFAERQQVFGALHPAEFVPPVSWHLDTLRGAGFRECGVIWRGGSDAAVAAVA